MRRRRREWWVGGILLILLAWALRLYRLGDQSFWYDEGYAVYTATLRPAETLLWSSRDFVPPLHPYLLALWLPLSGWTEFAARYLSAWMGLLLVAGMMRLGADLHTWRSGLLGGLLAALSPFYVWYSQETRAYMCQAAFGLLATLNLLRALRRPDRWGWWWGLAVLDALALYGQATAGFLVVFHGLVVLVAAVIQRRWIYLSRGGTALAGAVMAWMPWVIYAFPFLRENAGYWAGQLGGTFIVTRALRGFVTGGVMDGALETATLVVWGVVGLVGLVALLITTEGWGWRAALFLLTYFTVPAVAMAALFRGVPKFSPRYLILASPPVYLLPALGGAALIRRPGVRRAIGGLALVTLIGTAGLGLGNLYLDPDFAKTDFRAAARLVRKQMTADEIVLLVPGHMFPVWQFYFGSEGWVTLPDDPILDVRHVLHYRDVVGRLNRWLDNRSGMWLVEWEPWVVDPTGLVVHLLEQVGESIPMTEEPIGLQLRHYRLQTSWPSLPPEPAVSPPGASSLDLPLNLTGCTLPARLPGDGELRVGCYWEARDRLPLHLNVSARLVDEAGTEWGRADTSISGPHLVAGRWPIDQAVLGRYALWPFPGVPPGNFYQLELLVYEPDSDEHGSVVAGPVTIGRPSRPFTATLSTGRESPSRRLGGLTLEAVDVRPDTVLPGAKVRMEAIWRVEEPFHEPYLTVEGDNGAILLLPRSGATDSWRIGDRYRTITPVPISPHAMGGPTEVMAISEDGEMTLAEVNVDVTRAFTVPAGIRPMGYRLDDAISLVGTRLSVEPGEAGDVVDVVLYWRSEDFVASSYTVFVHLVGPDGKIYAQADSPPRNGRHPTAHWLPGEVVEDGYRLVRPGDAPVGEYRLLAGMYDPVTLERLPVVDPASTPVPDDAILIGSFEGP